MNLTDSHCHLQDPRLLGRLPEMLSICRARGINRWMVNATRQEDWPCVEALCREHPGAHPSFGLHPWWSKNRPAGWEEELEGILRKNPQAGVGETGLDQWMAEADVKDQRRVLSVHLELARLLDRPISLHCLKAWPDLQRSLKESPPPARGFLLHSYGGPPEDIPLWVKAGAFFSFSPAFLHPRKTARRLAFQSVPLERLLLETDAPDMAPPPELALEALSDGEGAPLNHPLNLLLCCRALAHDRGISVETLAEATTANAQRFFGWSQAPE